MKRQTWIAAPVAAAALAATASGGIVDLTAPSSFGIVNGARFETADFRPAGIGAMDTFVRLHHMGTEQGYNTSGRPTAFNEMTQGTRDLRFGEIPTVSIGGVAFKEFLLDISEPRGEGMDLLSLDKVQIYTSAVGGQTTGTLANLGTLRYNLDQAGDNWIKLDANMESMGGSLDMRMFVPVSAFGGIADSAFVYLFSRFGTNYGSEDGPEAWAVRSEIVPLPRSFWVAGATLGLAAFVRLRKRG